MKTNPIRELSLNKPQLRSLFYKARVQVDRWSRGTGKSFNHGNRIKGIVGEMPRSKNAIEGETFEQVLTKTLPGVVESLEKLGYYEGVHYVLNRRPPAKWERAYQPPAKYDNTMAWYNGTLFQILTEQREGSGRGLNLDSVTADEGLTLDKDKLQKGTIPASRGRRKEFMHSRYYHSVHISSSKGFGKNDRWIADYGKYYAELGVNYSALQNQIVKAELALIDSENADERRKIWKEILALKSNLKWFPSPTGFFYNEADVFDNIQNFGWQPLKVMRTTMTDLNFLVEVLNMDYNGLETCFYGSYSDLTHLYRAPNINFFENFDYDLKKVKEWRPNSLKDTDLLSNLPIDISCDYGSVINCLVASQSYFNTDWILNGMFVKRELIDVLIENFCEYYRFHKTKRVNYIFDHTAKPTHASSKVPYYEIVRNVLIKNGWEVNLIDIGQAPHHHEKHTLINLALSERDGRLNKIRFNQDNCGNLISSIKNAGIRQGKNGFEKDKSGELGDILYREQATDFSDAFDTMIWYKNSRKFKNRTIHHEMMNG
jgi:hypothetical protein